MRRRTGLEIGRPLGFPLLVHGSWFPADVLWTIGAANLALAAVNLLPGYPLDGGRLLTAFVGRTRRDKRSAEMTATRAGQLIGLLAVAGGVWFALAGVAAIEDTAIGL